MDGVSVLSMVSSGSFGEAEQNAQNILTLCFTHVNILTGFL